MKQCDEKFRDDVLLRGYESLVREGFHRFRKMAVDLTIVDGFRCWVGLNDGLYPDHVQINPFVGVHVVPIDRLWADVCQGKGASKYDRGAATYAIHLGEIAPNETEFRFTRETDIDAETNRLAKLIREVGVAYAKSIASYEALLPLLIESD